MSSNANENPQNQLLTRVSEIPLVKAFCQRVASSYETTKNSIPLLGATLGKVEGYAKFANEQAEPLKKLLDRPLSVVSKIADQQLEELQRRFPVINTTPTEIVEYGQNLYERSGVKHRVDDISVAKSRSVDKITGSTAYYRNRLVGSAHNGQVALNRYISGTLDFTEGVIDRFVAPPDSKKRSYDSKAHASYADRVRCLSGKVVGGVAYQTTSSVNAVKAYATNTYTAADKLVRDTVSSVASSVQKTAADVARVRQAVLDEIAKRSHALTEKSDATAVYLTKTLSYGVANISDRVLTSATPFLPEGLEKPAASLASYAHHWQERVERASTIGDVLKVATDETKQNLRLVRGLIQSIVNNGEAHVADNKRW